MKQQSAASRNLDSVLVRDAQERSKAMIRLGHDHRPFLDYLLENIQSAGYRDVVIVMGANDESICGHYQRQQGAARFPRLALSYVVQEIPPGRQKPLGTADALLVALRSAPSWKGGKFTVCNSDNLYSITALQLLLGDSHDNALIDYDRASLQFDENRIAQFAVITCDEQGFVKDIREKPPTEAVAGAADATGRIGVSMNIFRFSTDQILPFLEGVPLHPVRQEKELPAAVSMLVTRRPGSVFAIPLAEHVPDLTAQSDISDVMRLLNPQSTHNTERTHQ
jgi:NDP-sugar pyrophosphorylase family protein